MALAFGDKELDKNFEKVSLSHQTIARRAKDLSDNVKVQLKNNVKISKYCSLALDESINISDMSRLLVFISSVDENFSVCKELLETSPLHVSTKGFDISNSLVSVVEVYGGFEKCDYVVADDVRAMTGQRTGIVDILNDHEVNCPTFNYIIHQETLCTKSL